MLRALQSPHIRGEITIAQVTTTATPSAIINKAPGDFVSVTRNLAGKITLIPVKPLVTPPIMLADAFGGADGDFVSYDTDPTSNALVAQYKNAAGTAVEGSINLLMFGRGNACIDRVLPYQSVKNSAKNPRMIAARINVDGTVSIGASRVISVTVTSAGIYTIVMRKAFGRVPIAFATPIKTTQASATVTSTTASTIVVTMCNISEAKTATPFDLLVFGWDASQEQWGMDRVVQFAQIKPRIEAMRLNGTSGALMVGTLDGSVVKNSTGDYTLTFTKPFYRAPLVFVTAKSGRAQMKTAATTTSVTFLATNAAGTVSDEQIDIIVTGFDGIEV